MGKGKLCIDIGGTKIIFAIINRDGDIIKSKRIDTPKSKDLFLEVLTYNITDYLQFSNNIINVSIAGRIDNTGKIIFSPNLPILGFNFMKFMKGFSSKVTIENDGNCFGAYHLYAGDLKKYKSALVVVWGTGIGSSIIYSKKIYKGGGLAAESGHIVYDYNTGEDIESAIGGKSIEQLYGIDGFGLQKLAEGGDKKALKAFDEIGRMFGFYLSSMILILDPEAIIIGGSFANSWKFIKDSVYKVVNDKKIRRKIKIEIARGKFYVVRGCYFIDEYENSNNKL